MSPSTSVTMLVVMGLLHVTLSQLAGYQAGGGGGGGNDFGGAGGSEDGGLEVNIPGIPGQDYPIFAEVPDTGFDCNGRVEGGYYADPAADCQPFHICANDGAGGLTKYSVLCPNGTIFNQNHFICDWWFNFDCSTAEGLYGLNDAIGVSEGGSSGGSGGSGGNGGGGAPAGYGSPRGRK